VPQRHARVRIAVLSLVLLGTVGGIGLLIGADDADDPFADDTPTADQSKAPADSQGTKPVAAEVTEKKPVERPWPPSPSDPKPRQYNKWQTPSPGEYLGYNQRARLIQHGLAVYDKYCVGCHGEQGKGEGPAAKRLITQPRDFTSGIYKFRSTDSGSLPMEADLYRTITRGLSRVSMPAFPLMPEYDKVAVIEYIKSLYPKWNEEKDARKLVFVPRPPVDLMDATRVKRGHVIYIVMQCGKCHGIDGAGTGATQTEYEDAWGDPQKAFNFTRGRLKGGDDPQDIYRTFHTGLRSIMPSYGLTVLATANVETFNQQATDLDPAVVESLKPVLDAFPATGADVFSKLSPKEQEELGERNSWDLVAYVLSLRQPISTRRAVLGDPPTQQATPSPEQETTD